MPDIDFNSSPALTRHEDYYFEDGNLIILVENTLFRVFRSTFTRHSATFSDLFDLPPANCEGTVEGSVDWNPIILSGILVVDFERLLWVLYPPSYGIHKASTIGEWLSILDLATRWEFTSVRELAIRELQTLHVSPVDCIAICQKYDIANSWTLAAYVSLCERPEPLTMSEANQIGLETVVRIAEIRERLRSTNSLTNYRTPTCAALRRTEHVSGAGSKTTVSGRLQWDIGESFLDQARIPPPRVMSNKGSAIRPLRPMPVRSVRLVAEAFGLPLGSCN
ncbi:unnamed protein product [Somion occarium]|uniref:BTB domain-containing protein n=1 Tax=Somion occarium TaxID=3059160 RepID=A0ABP1DVD9_9APHY